MSAQLPILILPYAFVLLLAGHSDLVRRRVSDFLSGLCWLLLLPFPQALIVSGAAFGACVAANGLWYSKYRRPLLEWGDLLTFPTFFGVCAAILPLAAPAFLAVLVLMRKEQRGPLVAYMAAGLLGGLILSVWL